MGGIVRRLSPFSSEQGGRGRPRGCPSKSVPAPRKPGLPPFPRNEYIENGSDVANGRPAPATSGGSGVMSALSYLDANDRRSRSVRDRGTIGRAGLSGVGVPGSRGRRGFVFAGLRGMKSRRGRIFLRHRRICVEWVEFNGVSDLISGVTKSAFLLDNLDHPDCRGFEFSLVGLFPTISMSLDGHDRGIPRLSLVPGANNSAGAVSSGPEKAGRYGICEPLPIPGSTTFDPPPTRRPGLGHRE